MLDERDDRDALEHASRQPPPLARLAQGDLAYEAEVSRNNLSQFEKGAFCACLEMLEELGARGDHAGFDLRIAATKSGLPTVYPRALASPVNLDHRRYLLVSEAR